MNATSNATASHDEPIVELPPAAPLTASARGLGERWVEAGLTLCGLLSVAMTAGLVLTLLAESVRFFSDVSPVAFFGGLEWAPRVQNQRFGVWPLVGGTLLTSAVAMAVAVPMGLLAAVYLSEFAAPSVRRRLKPALEVLAGIPTIVFGYFALLVVTPALQSVMADLSGFNALSAGLVIGLMLTPMIFSLCEDAISAVPHDVSEAAFALGAYPLTTIFRVVLPAASSGIRAAILLAFGRALGETVIVAIAAGHQARLTADPTVPIETMTGYVLQVASSGAPAGTLEYRTIFAVGGILFVFTLLMNVLAHRLRHRLRAPSEGVS